MDLLENILVFNPYFRPTVDELLEHPYFTCVRNPSLEMTSSKEVYLEVENLKELNVYKLQDMFVEEIKHFKKLRESGQTYLQQ